jgi:nucleotide-binding universal stress UspA family protein
VRRDVDVTVSGERRLVVGVDGTAAGVAALRWAVGQAGVVGARVLALAVGEPAPVVVGGPEVGGGMVPPSVPDQELFTAAADAWLTEAVEALSTEERHAVDRQVRHGDPATVLLEAASDADLLVLGNHGRGGLAGALTGSVAQRCAHHVSCPVVLVPAPETG